MYQELLLINGQGNLVFLQNCS